MFPLRLSGPNIILFLRRIVLRIFPPLSGSRFFSSSLSAFLASFFPLAGSIFYFHFSFIPPLAGLSSCFFSSFFALLARTILVPSPPFLAQTFSSSRVELFYKISSPPRVEAYFLFSLPSGPFHTFSGSILSLSLQTDILSYVLVFLRLSGSNIFPLTGLFSFSFLRFSS